MKRLRVLQILNFWRLIPAYMCICMAPKEVKNIVIEELYHWKKCDKRKEVSRFDIFSGLCWNGKSIVRCCSIDSIGGWQNFC